VPEMLKRALLLSIIVAERNASNEPTHCFPPVLPYDLVKLRPFDFSQLTAMHMQRLRESFSEEAIIQINDEFKEMKNNYRHEQQFKQIIDGVDHKTSFSDGWKILVNRYPLLCSFIGALASVFPGTSTVESDFSLIGWEKDEYRTSLTNFSLEGILHCKQFDHLNLLAASLKDE
jgi:hypothetical protein